MAIFVDENETECTQAEHLAYIADKDNSIVGEESVAYDVDSYCLWTRYQGVGDKAWQLTVTKMQETDANGYDGHKVYYSSREDAVAAHANIKTKIEAGDSL